MSSSFRRFEMLLPKQYNDGTPVPFKLYGKRSPSSGRGSALSVNVRGDRMDVVEALRDGLPGWTIRPPGASPKVVDGLSSASPIRLPSEYLDLLRFSNGGEGELGVEPGWFMFWPAEEVLEYNRGYNLSEWLPGFFGFGSNGGGELLAFDTRSGEPWAVVMVPFIPLDLAEAVTIAPDFPTFIRAVGRVQQIAQQNVKVDRDTK